MKNAVCISALLVLLGMVSQDLYAQEAPVSEPQALASMDLLVTDRHSTAALTPGSPWKPTDSRTMRLNEGIKSPSFDHLARYIAEHLEYPELARHNGLEGEVKLQLVISPEGKVMESTVLQGLGLGCDEAAQQMTLLMPAWTPASNYGVPVKGKAIVVVQFKLK
ncbi:MAG TPA: energy transducer TonB [Saprospiraceae bacterium]|nr:energy transducer TonB [Saprospiraceae bacterium]